MRYFITLIVLILIFIVACDRFDNSFENQDEQPSVLEFFTSFSDSLTAKSIDGIMSFYCEEYSNNGTNKEQVEQFYADFISQEYQLESTITDTIKYPEITWNLIVKNSQKETIIDSTIVDYLIQKDESYLFNGNQADMRNVLVELFTATWCPNCPYAEEALHNLHTEYGNRFIYFEYHIADALEIPGNSQQLNYYEESSLPVTVVNGNSLVMSGAGPTIQNTIQNTIQPLLNETAQIQICLDEMEITDNVLSLQTELNIDAEVPRTNLFLNYVLVEDLDENNYNVNGDQLHYVVKFKNQISLADYTNQESISITIENMENYPQDSSIILWVQTLEPNYNEATCQVYNVIKKRIE